MPGGHHTVCAAEDFSMIRGSLIIAGNVCSKKQLFPFTVHADHTGGKLKDIIILYKYKGYRVLGKALASFVHRTLGEDDSLWWHIDALVPVPLHPKKEAKRGFNQAKILALELSKLKNVPLMEKRLIKVRNTHAQTSLREIDRLGNLKGAFDVTHPEEIEGKVLLLVDDVFTTGATLQECTVALKKAGAQEIRALTLAQA
jgi:competence protein ComFC